MNKLHCRYSACAMSFPHPSPRQQHENLMHRTLMQDSSRVFLNRVLKTNPAEALNKKVLHTVCGDVSYNQANDLFDEDTPEGEAVRELLKNVVIKYYEMNPDFGMNDIANSDLKIN